MQTPAKTDAQQQKGQEDNGGFLSRKHNMVVEEDHAFHGFPLTKKKMEKKLGNFLRRICCLIRKLKKRKPP